MWTSRRTCLSNNWTSLLCAMKWVTGLVHQAFPLCSQTRMRIEQGEDSFPVPAFGRNSPRYFLVLQSEAPCSSHSCLWMAATSHLLSPVSRACLSFPSSAADACFEDTVFGFSQSYFPFHTNCLLPSPYFSSTFFPSNPTLGASFPGMATPHQMTTFIRRVAATGR